MNRFLPALSCLLLLAPSLARAHDVGLQCKQANGSNKVSVEVFFDDDSPAVAAKVTVLAADKTVVAAGTTNGDGLWTFEAPSAGAYKVMVDAGVGHLAERMITVRPWLGESAGEAESPNIHEGPSREEFTRFPWLKAAIGVGVIFLFSAAFFVLRRKAPDSVDSR